MISGLSLEGLKQQQAELLAYQQQEPVLFALGFIAIYILVTGLSLPGAAILTLAAGLLFDLVLGTILVSIASTLGATLAFLGARYLARDPLERRFAERLAGINAGVQAEGSFYLFSLRLIPLVPFFMINLLFVISYKTNKRTGVNIN